MEMTVERGHRALEQSTSIAGQSRMPRTTTTPTGCIPYNSSRKHSPLRTFSAPVFERPDKYGLAGNSSPRTLLRRA